MPTGRNRAERRWAGERKRREMGGEYNYVIVGFKVKEENSVHYAKAKTVETMLENVNKAFEKGAEFISLRRIPSPN